MDIRQLIDEMNAYYKRRAPWHDRYMNYISNEKMENLLAPIIIKIEPYLIDQDILEIACGTGNWTQVLSKRARSVLATDISEAALDLARQKEYPDNNVNFIKADAYSLKGLKGKFNLAFAADWFSHIPISMVSTFIAGLHNYLCSMSTVIFIDMMFTEADLEGQVFYDQEGNRIRIRTLPDGSNFNVVKNFPSENDLRRYLDQSGQKIDFIENLLLRRWILIYNLIH